MKVRTFLLLFLSLSFFSISGAGALDVVSTTTVLWDPIQYMGGDNVDIIYIADPAVCPHMQGDIIPNRIQMERDFIKDADLFVAHNSSVDQQYVMPYIDDFMESNEYGTVDWVTLKDPNMTWNTPENALKLAEELKGWLVTADPGNSDYYERRYASYCEMIEGADLSDIEKEEIRGQDVVVMIWQKGAAEQWLYLDSVSFFAPEFYQGGKYTATKVVDDINSNPEKYGNVVYVIENMQSGELGKGIEEALKDRGIDVKRVIFTNFPKSVDGVNSIPDVLEYNKQLVMPVKDATTSEKSPGFVAMGAMIGIGISAVLFIVGRTKR